MARPVKRRRVCGLPPVGAFRPEGGPGGPVIEVTVDEYEAVRLIDLLGLTQEECAAQMNVARTTVQAIYDSAREKLACMLAEGRPLTVQGGTYDLCGQAEHCCGRRCRRANAWPSPPAPPSPWPRPPSRFAAGAPRSSGSTTL